MSTAGPNVQAAGASSAAPHRFDAVRLPLLVLAGIVLVRTLLRLHDAIGLVLLAAAVAALTEPLRGRLSRRLHPGLATALTALTTLGAVLALGALVYRDLGAQAGALSSLLTDRLDRLEPGSLAARVAASVDARRSVVEVLDRLPGTVVAGEGDAPGMGRRVLDLVLVVILAAFFQAGARSARDAVVTRWPRHRRAGVRVELAEVERLALGFVRRALALAVVTAVVVWSLATSTDLPAPVVLGVWAGMWLVVPRFGWLLALAPVVLVAWAEHPGRLPVVLAACAAIALLRAAVGRRLRARLPLARSSTVVVAAYATGVAVGGVGGVAVCLVLFSVAITALDRASGAERRTAEPPLVGSLEPARPTALPRAVGHVDAEGRLRILEQRGELAVAALATVMGVLAWMLAGALSGVLVWAVISSFVALAFARPARWCSTVLRLPRALAVVLLLTVTVAGITIAAVSGVRGSAGVTRDVRDELPRAIEQLEGAPVVGGWLQDRHLDLWVDERLAELPTRAEGSDRLSRWLPTVGSRLLDLFWTALLAVSLLLEGPAIVAAVERRVPARQRRQYVRLAGAGAAAISGYLAGAALVALLNAGVVLTLGLTLGIALAPVLAVWAFLWNFVPQVGGFMGGFPLVVLAMAESPVHAVVAAGVFVTYQFVENHLIQPAVISEAIDIPSWATLLSAIAGGAAAGVIGAVVLTPLVGVVRVLLSEMRREDFPGQTVRLERNGT